MTEPGAGAHSPPPTVCVVGFKDSGKTTVAVRLVAELRNRGHRVAVVKHGHRFQLDTPGTDSWRLRHEGGADPVLLAGPEDFALFGSWGPGGEPDLETLIRTHVGGADVVVAEGFKEEPFPKVEVHRADAGHELLYRPGLPEAERFLALVTDHPEPHTVVAPDSLSLLQLDDPKLPARLADLVEGAVMRSA